MKSTELYGGVRNHRERERENTKQCPKTPPPSATSYDWLRHSSINFCLCNRLSLPWLIRDSTSNESNYQFEDLHYSLSVNVQKKKKKQHHWNENHQTQQINHLLKQGGVQPHVKLNA
jgi:hypothetical protein